MTIRRIEGIREVLPPKIGVMDFAKQLIPKYNKRAVLLTPGKEYPVIKKGPRRNQIPDLKLRAELNGEGTVFDPSSKNPVVSINEERPVYVVSHYTQGRRFSIIDEIDFYTEK